jgi:hypothetical protein
MSDIKEILLKHSESGEIYLRNAVVFALFLDKPASEVADQVIAILDRFLALVPPGTLKWAIPSASAEQWRPLDDKVLVSIRKSMAPAAVRARDVSAFRLSDSEGEAPRYEFEFEGKPKVRRQPPPLNLLQMVFPIESVQAKRVKPFVDEVAAIAASVDYRYGYCSPALLYSELRLANAYMEIRGLAMRYPGYDVHQNILARLTLGKAVRGARWITLLGAPLLDEIGGIKALQRALKPPVALQDVGSGVMIRASEVPEIGDVNRQVDTPALRQVASVLEPITQFGERGLVFTQLEPDDVFLGRWERRFLD